MATLIKRKTNFITKTLFTLFLLLSLTKVNAQTDNPKYNNQLAEIGKLVAAGPIKKNDKDYEGIFILNVKTIEEAKVLLETDPAIQTKMLDTELFQWYGSAALPLYLKYHDNIKKKNF